MPQLAANLSTLFTELPFLERYAAAARAGFRAVECQFPYAIPAAAMAEQQQRHGLTQVLLNAPAGNLAEGERGIAAFPDRVEECRRGLHVALDYARATGAKRLHLLAGIRPPELPRETALAVFIDNLIYAADLCADDGIQVLVEPINSRVDVPGYLVDSTAVGLDCIGKANRPNLRLQYDAYHMQIMEGDLARSIERLLGVIGHIQIADNPGRHEPGTGEIRFDFLFEELERLGYDGWIGCEYRPAGRTEEGLGWLPAGALGLRS